MKRSLAAAVYLSCHALVAGFTNPIKTYNGSDPQMVYYDGMYYLTSTSWTDVEITSAATIEGLKTATPQVIYTDNTTERSANWWAPELWQIDGTWYIYFTAGVKDSSWDVMLRTLNVWVLKGGIETPTSDPYTLVGELRPSNDAHGMLDGTTYVINDKRYFFYSSVNNTDNPIGATLWVAELTSPTTIGESTMIAYPEYDWETTPSAVIEGPAGITSPDGTVYIAYSANTCNGPEYALGALRLAKDADPLSTSSWTKLAEPILTTNTTAGEYGPGHNGFFKSPDGTQDWIVFHANRDENGSCDAYRQTFVQQVTWSNNAPVLQPLIEPGVEITEPSTDLD
ncbi:glycosyl hydrolase [Truncatella angustata]|uniref:Glycosyl hydrolase n=1 Tax=Truncatella angustata TaxID=152316 RepID=A0A9P8RNG3_9PEZI|nr:glycosyl hydrolase [Truncatella angustata]KAH6646680.1 glycosyl hydrolase [Truncatella angustata]